jgi:resuscitation-promoting factor RpfA
LFLELITAVLVRHHPPTASRDSHRQPLWGHIAQCESGKDWHINTGNGYYGGLQISPTTWQAYGGQAYAPLPHQASRHDQIVIAGRILRGQGIGAWPVCGRG